MIDFFHSKRKCFQSELTHEVSSNHINSSANTRKFAEMETKRKTNVSMDENLLFQDEVQIKGYLVQE